MRDDQGRESAFARLGDPRLVGRIHADLDELLAARDQMGQLLGLTWTDRAGEHLRLVVLADTGGAFEPNLFQLDWLGGTFPSQQAWRQWAKTVPGRVHAQILVRR